MSQKLIRTQENFLGSGYGKTVQTLNILGIPMQCLTYPEFFEACEWYLKDKTRTSLSVAAVNVNCCVSALDSEEIYNCYRAADVCGIDGMPFVHLASLLLGRRMHQLSAPVMMTETAKYASRRPLRFFLMGGMPGAAEIIKNKLESKYPGVNVVGTACPPFRPLTPEEDEALVKQINDAQPDFLWIGLGSPKQDLWIRDHKERLHGCIVVASGATFDFFSGRIRQAPKWVSYIGFEWLFRLTQDFRRLWKRCTVYNVRFVIAFTSELLGFGMRAQQ